MYIQVMQSLKPWHDEDLDEEVVPFAVSEKVVRKHAYEQVRASFAMLYDWLGKDMGAFLVPEDMHFRAVSQGEKRLRIRGRAYFYTEGQQLVPVLPEGARASNLYIAVFDLDQGSIGVAGMAYSKTHNYLVEVFWDFPQGNPRSSWRRKIDWQRARGRLQSSFGVSIGCKLQLRTEKHG